MASYHTRYKITMNPRNRILLISGILSFILFISTIISAGEESSFLFEDFDFTIGEKKVEFLTASFDDLFNIFGRYSTLTDSQREDSWRKYKERYVRWEGIVTYKGLSKDDRNRVGIRHNLGTNVELIFNEDKKDMIGKISRGDKITYTGRLSFLFDRNLLFRLEDANIERFNDMTFDELKGKLKDEAGLSIQSSQISETSTASDLNGSSEDINILPFAGINRIFGKDSSITESRKKELWDFYSGKYIRWEGVVTYKGLGKDDRNRVGISHNVGTNVELIFDKDKEEIVKMIKNGDKIIYTGKLAKLFGRNLLCSIEGADIKKIGDKTITEIARTASAVYGSAMSTGSTIEGKFIDEPEIIMAESMAPKVIRKEDIEITETIDGYLKLPFEKLDELFGRENKMTESQKDKLWDKYKDKYVRWTGVVMSRGKGRISGLRMGIKHKTGTDVELIFDKEKEDAVMKTEEGDKITYTGRLVTRRGYILPYKLEDGHIESIVNIHPDEDQEY